MEDINEVIEDLAVPNDFPPSGSFQLKDPETGTVELALVDEGGRLKFEIRNISGDFYRRNSEGKTVLSITRDAEITFQLGSSVAWSWNQNPGPFRLKKRSSSRFYRIKNGSVGSNSFVLEAQASGLPRADPMADQPFNLYVLVEQVGDAPFPVCIDPGGQNPPR
jgi:hypothetical protein